MTEIARPEIARSVVVDYLISSGWQRTAEGALGDLWRRGDAETVVPYSLEVGSAPWNRLAAALAQPNEARPADVLERWQSDLRDRLRTDYGSVSGVGRIEMEIHLDGQTVVHHETRAYEFGQFVMRAAESVKELVKTVRGTKRHPRELLVAGGPAEGSVKVTFREPDRADSTALLPEAPETSEGQALLFLALMFASAETAGNGGPDDLTELRSRLAPLGVGARQSLARLAETVIDASWLISGVIRRGGTDGALQLGPAGAQVLRLVSREGLEEERIEQVIGTLDGWVWSRSELTLITDDQRSLRAAVPLGLQSRVALLHAQPETRVVTRLAVYMRVVQGTGDAIRTVYSLVDIRTEDPPHPTLDEDEE